MATKEKVIDATLALLIAGLIAIVGYVVALGNRTTALEHQIVTDTQIMQLMNKFDQRLTINETLLQQVIKERDDISMGPSQRL